MRRHQINARLPYRLLIQLRRSARRLGISVSEVLRRLIEEHLK